MDDRIYKLIPLIIITISIISPIVLAYNNIVSDEILAKIDPALHNKLNTNELVEVVVRIKPLPTEIVNQVRGKYNLAVAALKSWAEQSQRPVVDFIVASGGQVLNRFWLDNVILVKVPGTLLIKIATLPEVIKIFRNFEVYIVEPVIKEPSEFKPTQVSSWGIFKIRAPEAWAMGYTGTGVRIAVLDTGVDITHPALAGKMLTLDPTSPYYPGGWMEFDSAGNPVLSTPHDTHGHGTHCSGTALGGNTENILIGVAPGATLMHGLVLPGGGGTFAQVLAGMQWTVNPFYIDPGTGQIVYTGLPAHVVSMSWGASEYYGNELLPAVEAMILANIIPVAAIGNGGPGTTSNPGNIWGVFGIGATDINDSVASWSSGKVVTWPSPPPTWPFFDTYPSTYIKPDLSAPGVSIRSSVPGGGYEDWSGTSMATPHVSGTVALIIQAAGWNLVQVPDIPEKIYIILNSTAIDFGDPGQDIRYGWGRIDAYEAVRKAQEYAKISGVEGYVRDEVTSEPVPWAQVTVLEVNITVPVSRDGYFKIPLDPGNYTLLIEAWGYQPVTISVEVVILNGTITGVVYNALTGLPIEGANVTVVELALSVTTDEQGVYEVSVTPGTYTLIAEAAGYSPSTTTVRVGEAEIVVVNFGLYPLGNGTIAGHVYDNTTGLPIVDAVVYTYVEGQLVYDITDSAGYYELSVPSGSYNVCAWKLGYIESCVSNIQVAPLETVIVDFYLQPIPPTVVVLGNVDYRTVPHLKTIVMGLGLPVVEYNNMTKLLIDWINGEINPKVVIIDHTMPSPYSYPPADVVLAFHMLADVSGSTLIWLCTSYSGYPGIYVLMLYNSTLVGAGYPAPRSRLYAYPTPTYVQVTMLNLTHPIFDGVTPDIPPNRFYLGTGSYVDYVVYNFTDPTGRFTTLAYVNDTRTGYLHYYGVGVAEWISNSNVPWYYLGSWAESYWMQYLEPGADGMYTNNTKKVLENAIILGWTATPTSLDTGRLIRVLEILSPLLRQSSFKDTKEIKPYLYTYVEVYMPRLPYGYVTGRVIGADGQVLAGATVSFLDTPVKVTTNETGYFYTWLPVGVYTASISMAGYKTVYVNFTINLDETTDLGTIILPLVTRVAILYDYGGEIKRQLESYGLYAVDYTDLTQLISDLQTGFYQAVIWAGYYGIPFPPCSLFQQFLNVTDTLGIGVIFMDSYGYYGYGIKVLNSCLGDPPSVGYTWGYGEVYVVVTGRHPILKGYEVGQSIKIIAWTGADFSWFTGFSGIEIADVIVGGIVYGNAIAWLVRPGGSKWALLSSFPPTQWNTPGYFTPDAWKIIFNAVKWVATRPLAVTLENPYLHVGDLARVLISNAPPITKLIILLDGEPIGETLSSETGDATFEFNVPLIPGGEHLIEVYTEDELYYGFASLYVMPKVIAVPLYVIAPGVVFINVTGLGPLQQVYIYLDGNWLSLYRANKLGTFQTRLNIPLVAEGEHEIAIVDPITGEVLTTIPIQVVSRLEQIGQLIEEGNVILATITEGVAILITDVGEIRVRLEALEPVILDINDNVVTILTELGVIRADLQEIRELIEEGNAILLMIVGDTAVIRTDVGEIKAKIEALEPVILDINDNVVTILTELGVIRADLLDVKALITSSKEAIISAIEAGVAAIKIQIDNSTLTIMSKLSALEPVIVGISDNVLTILTRIGRLEANVTTILSKLDVLDAKIVDVKNNIVTVQTSIGELKITLNTVLDNLALLNTTILSISSDVAIIKTKIGSLQVSVNDLLTALQSVNASISQLIIDSRGEIIAVISTSKGDILANITATKQLIQAGLPISTSELRDALSKLISDTGSQLGSKVDEVGGKVDQASGYAIATIVLSVIILGLAGYIAYISKRRP